MGQWQRAMVSVLMKSMCILFLMSIPCEIFRKSLKVTPSYTWSCSFCPMQMLATSIMALSAMQWAESFSLWQFLKTSLTTFSIVPQWTLHTCKTEISAFLSSIAIPALSPWWCGLVRSTTCWVRKCSKLILWARQMDRLPRFLLPKKAWWILDRIKLNSRSGTL